MKKIACILLVDDDSTTNFLNELLLHDLDVAEQVLVAENGAEALKTLVQFPVSYPSAPVLVLLDVNMPVMNGFEFLEAYQQVPQVPLRAVVIVMLTTSLHPRDMERIRLWPVAGLVSKPLSKEKVIAILQEHFQPEWSA